MRTGPRGGISLRQRLLLGSGVVIVTTLAAVVVLVDVVFRSTIRQDLEEDLTFALQVARDARSDQMRDRVALTAQTALDTRLRAAVETGDPPTVRQALLEVVPRGQAGWSAVVDTRGRILAATPGTPVHTLEGSSPVIEEAFYFDTGDLWIEESTLFEVGASAILFGSSPLGILVTGTPLDQAQLSALEGAVGRAVTAVIQGSTIVGAEAQAMSERAREQVSQLDHAHGGVHSVVLDGEVFLATSMPLLSSMGQTIGVLTLLDSLDAALRPSRALRAGLLMIFLLGLGVALTAGRLFFRSITGPVARLVAETRRLATGQLDRAIHPVRNDEIGQLASAFEAMRVSLRDARDELIRAERLGAIGQAASAVAHDFAQPLTVISGSVSLLELEPLDGPQRQQCFDAIEQQLARLDRMRQEMTEFARGESKLDLLEVPMDGFLDQIASGLQYDMTRRNIELEVSHGYLGLCTIDPDRLGRVIENLVRNAAAAIRDQGHIRIRTWATEGTLWLEVEDDGPGIPEEILDNVFEPFVSHGKKDGTGLGLAIAANVVGRHGGTISVRSNTDGTCFTIQLPAAGILADGPRPSEPSPITAVEPSTATVTP